MESYDEILFPEPSESFLARVQNHPAKASPKLPAGLTLPSPMPVEDLSKRKRGDTKDHPLTQWFMNVSEANELLQLAVAHQQMSISLSEISGYIENGIYRCFETQTWSLCSYAKSVIS